MTYYDPRTNYANHRDSIDRAYIAADLTPPTRAAEIFAALHAEPTLDTVTVALAREALTTRPDATKWLAGALEKVQHAQAVATLLAALTATAGPVESEELPAMIETAAADLAPAFGKLAKTLTTAAATLPQGDDPLALEAVVELDATKAMKAAQSALSALTAYAGIHEVGTPGGRYTPALARLLPVVALPQAVVELVARGRIGIGETVNGEELAGTLAIRRLDDAASKHGLDRALIGVARGEFPGCTLGLAGWTEHEGRRANAARAFERDWASNRPTVTHGFDHARAGVA